MKPTNSADPSFWEERYQAGNRPWENYGIPKLLTHVLGSIKPTGKVLLPGCGSAYEIKAFLEAGWDAWGIDFSETAVKRAKEILPEYADRILLGDFFDYQFEHSFDVIYERSFLCALPLQLRNNYAERMHDLLTPEGKLVGFFLYGRNFDGPPFPLQDLDEAKNLLYQFELVEDLSISDSYSRSGGKERWGVWKKQSSSHL